MQQAIEFLNRLRGQHGYEVLFRDVTGYLHVEEGCALCAMAAGGSGTGEVVEIGSYRGRSTCFLAFGLQFRGEGVVHAVDHFKGSPEHQEGESCEDAYIIRDGSLLPIFTENLKRNGLDQFVKPVVSSSVAAAREWDGSPIRLLFIDGDHSYEATRADFEAWEPFVPQGGFVAFHDVNDTWPGVQRFFKEITQPGTGWVLKLVANSLCVVQREG